MSAYAKSIVGAIAAVLVAGVTAWQAATSDGFQLVDLLPVAIAVAGALLVYVVPNVPELPTAKAWVAGVLAVLTALSTGLTGLSGKADAVQVVFAVGSAFLTWYVPNQAPYAAPHALPSAEPVAPAADPTAAALAHLDALDATDPAHAAAHGSQMGEAAHEPLPIEAEAQAAAAAAPPTTA